MEAGAEEEAACESCGFTEECTTAYMANVHKQYDGRWICRLCDAVSEELPSKSVHHSRNKRCFVCKKPTLGIFNAAHEIRKKMKQEKK